MSETRRHFIKKSAGIAIAAPFSLNYLGMGNSWMGANDRVRIGVVGIRGMGFTHIRNYSQLENVEVAALCDVDERLFAKRLKWLEDNGKPKPKLYRDIRDLLDDKDIDAISVATPNHWHALAGIWAAQAGKHATLEKPGTHNVFEGRQLIKAAEKYNTLIQHHAERRCFPGFQSAVEFLHSGGLGEVYMAKGLCYKWRKTIGKETDAPVPEGVDYDLWLGPAPKRPFNPNRFHYNWHWHWDYGNGDLGNQGAHQMDIARWGLGVKHPTVISSLGGHYMFDDDQETPNTQISVFEYPNEKGGGDKKKMMQFEVRHWITNHEGGIGEGSSNNIGNLFYGSEGYMVIDLGGNWKTFMGKNREPGVGGEGRGDMFENFVNAIRSNDKSQLVGSIEEGHYSCSLMHLANISYRVGRRLHFDPVKETFLHDTEADAMLTREYRHPFVVPEIV
jgi:predicted dehydrogenase